MKEFKAKANDFAPPPPIIGPLKKWLILLIVCLESLATAQVNSSNPDAEENPQPDSPWLFVPLISANPKLGTAAGALLGYIHKFDEKSRTSIFGVQAKYSKSASTVGGVFARTSWSEDHHRLNAAIAFGKINNEYQNYLDTGQKVDTQDKLRATFIRYFYRVHGNLFIGLQGAYTNYDLLGKSEADDEILANLGFTGYKSGGAGFIALYDSRDNDYKPTEGGTVNVNNIAYREAWGGSRNFDVYHLDMRYYYSHGNNNVLSFHQRNQWTMNAPPGAYSSIKLRGYTSGEFLAQNMSSIEIEERLAIAERWTSTIFAGYAVLYGDGSSTLKDPNFPSGGLGVQYILKPKIGLVLNLEGAVGRDDSNGFYLKIGYAF